jgi:thiol-disulfide isomerase/thioredoxin
MSSLLPTWLRQAPPSWRAAALGAALIVSGALALVAIGGGGGGGNVDEEEEEVAASDAVSTAFVGGGGGDGKGSGELPGRAAAAPPQSATAAGAIVELDERRGDALGAALARHKHALVYFTATWCGPCKVIAPAVARLALALATQGLCVIKVDVDKCPDAAAEFDVRGVPTFVSLRGGRVVQTLVAPKEEALKRAAAALLSGA